MFPGINAAGLLLRMLFSATLILPTAAGAQTQEPLLQQAQAALEKKDYAEAAQVLETYLAKNPQDYRAGFNLAFAYSLTGRRAEAIRLYQGVLAQEKELVPAHLNLGILLAEEGQAAEAVEHLRFVAEKQPENFGALLQLAQAFSALKRLPEAREAYERALKLKPDDAAAHLAYARLLLETDPASAESHLRSAWQADASLDDAKLLLASVLENRAAGGADTLGEAAAIYRQYLETHPERLDLRLRLGEIYARQKRYPEAVVQWEVARMAGDSSPGLLRALLEAYLVGPARDSDKALGLVDLILQQAVQKGTNDAEMRLLSGRLRMDKKQYPEAAEQFRRVTELQPNSAEGYTNLASALYLLKDYLGTVAALAKVTELGQDTAGTYFLRAITLDKLGFFEPALANYQRFLASDTKKNPDQEFQARERSKVLSRELKRGRSRRR